MFDWLVESFTTQPYPSVAIVFVLCGLGLPLPEEIVLIAAGYVCFKGHAQVGAMIGVCAAAILAGDAMPFLLGRVFGTRLLRIRWLRMVVTPRRLARFDVWFRRRGDLVIFIARFIPGIRVVAFFTAGTMRMRLRRFLLLDLAGIAVTVPLLVMIGNVSGPFVDGTIDTIMRAERGVLIGVFIATGLGAIWLWITTHRRRRRARILIESETFVGPKPPPPPPPPGA
jgi:membrane protein DedA with SNARE-associated domain